MTYNPAIIESAYLRQPALEYSRAFDLSAGAPGILAAVSSAAHAVELLRRCWGNLDFAGHAAFDADAFVREAQPWAAGAIAAVSLSTAKRYAALVWAEPEAPSAVALATGLRTLAQSEAILTVIASTPLRCYLPDWQQPPFPAQKPLTPGAVMRVLHTTGWRVESRVAFHGPRSLAWAKLAQLAELAGRPDWADRCLFAMRACYREPGWLWPLTPLALIRAHAI